MCACLHVLYVAEAGSYRWASPLEAAWGRTAEEDAVILGRELRVFEQKSSRQAFRFDVRIPLLRQSDEWVLLGGALRPPGDLGSGVRIPAPRAEALEADSGAPSSLAPITTHTKTDTTTSKGIAESDVEIAAKPASSARCKPDVGAARSADVVGFGFSPWVPRTVVKKGFDGPGSTGES